MEEEEEVLVKFYAGNKEETVNILKLLNVNLKDWENWPQQMQDRAIDGEHEEWMWNHNYVGWEKL